MKRLTLFFIGFVLLAYACSDGGSASGDAAHSGSKEREIRSYNLEIEKEQAKERTPCDTLSLEEFVMNNYPEGTYLVEFDRTFTYNIPKPAVIYKKAKNKTYIFAVIAKSKPGERFIEKKNIIGYESSFINLDSTKLGTAFFYLTLFECDKEGDLRVVWESEVPIHGGFNYIKLRKWRPKGIEYIQLNFEYGIISGHRDFNYFLVDGILNKPHLLETYEGIAQKRVMANLNNDKYPDYYEYRFIDTVNYNKVIDSIPFYWNKKKELYTTPVNKRWTRKY